MMVGPTSYEARKHRRERESQLPEWAHELTALLQNGLLNELRAGIIPDLSIETVRAHGFRGWMRVPNLGRKSVAELEEAIGGWEDKPANGVVMTTTPSPEPSLADWPDTELIAELIRRGYLVGCCSWSGTGS